jgi:hypothetical protein
MKLIIYFHLVARSRMVELYLCSSTHLHGVLLNELSTETTLPLTILAYTNLLKLLLNARFQFSGNVVSCDEIKFESKISDT